MSRSVQTTVPCGTCGQPTRSQGTRRCDRCGSVERLLDEYLQSPGGQTRVADALRRLGYHVHRSEERDETPGKRAVREVLADMGYPGYEPR
jgi:hypothetical protein